MKALLKMLLVLCALPIAISLLMAALIENEDRKRAFRHGSYAQEDDATGK